MECNKNGRRSKQQINKNKCINIIILNVYVKTLVPAPLVIAVITEQ
jgi:hypothetical protein